MLAKAPFPAFFLTLSGFVLLLLVTLSVPIIKTIYLVHVVYSNGSTAANLGVFGICYQGGDATYSGTAACIKPHVGYTLDTTFFGENLSSTTQRVFTDALAGSLILNPIAAGLAGISLITAFFAWFCASRVFEIFTFVTLFLASAAGWLAFWLDLALILVARKRIDDYTNGVFTGHVGNALWLALAGALALSFAICFAGCGVFGRYSDRYANRNRANRDLGAPVAVEKAGRRRL